MSKTTKTKPALPKPVYNYPKSMFLNPKPIKVVTKKVLNQIADHMFDAESGTYLNLCTGTLQNGPDPACEKRTMHCGLGELYLVVTGHHPEEDNVSEEGVVNEVVERSTIGQWAKDREKAYEQKVKKAKEQIKKMGLTETMTSDLLSQLESNDFHEDEPEFETKEEDKFRELLNSIPGKNDQGVDSDAEPSANREASFKARAKRVAEVLRKAAALLPS